MVIDLVIKVVEPIGKALLNLRRMTDKPEPRRVAASITYYTSGGQGGDGTEPSSSAQRPAA